MASALYSEADLLAGRLLDDTKAMKSYNTKVLNNLKNLYAKRKINAYEYGHSVNLLTCAELKLEEMKEKLTTLIDQKHLRTESIDLRV